MLTWGQIYSRFEPFQSGSTEYEEIEIEVTARFVQFRFSVKDTPIVKIKIIKRSSFENWFFFFSVSYLGTSRTRFQFTMLLKYVCKKIRIFHQHYSLSHEKWNLKWKKNFSDFASVGDMAWATSKLNIETFWRGVNASPTPKKSGKFVFSFEIPSLVAQTVYRSSVVWVVKSYCLIWWCCVSGFVVVTPAHPQATRNGLNQCLYLLR